MTPGLPLNSYAAQAFLSNFSFATSVIAIFLVIINELTKSVPKKRSESNYERRSSSEERRTARVLNSVKIIISLLLIQA